MKGKYFINTARGELVDEQCLLLAIRNNSFAGVAVDVVANENCDNSLDEWRKLLPSRNILLTPHIAGATLESMKRTEMFIAEKLISAVNLGEI